MTLNERVKKWNENFFKWNNFSDAGYSWVAIGDTFKIKEELKSAGAKFNRELGWHFRSEPSEFKTVRITLDDVTRKDCDGRIKYKEDAYDFINELKMQFIEPTNSEWVGEIGQKITIIGVLKDVHQFQSAFGLTNVFSFDDEDENTIVWMTTKHVPIEIGMHCELSGKIKAHNTFRGDKQTLLSRCNYYIFN